jgi:16S rRNA (guanine527-N7)-methyltransferase
MEEQVNEFRHALDAHAARYEVTIDVAASERLCQYYELLLAWNPRLHLVGPCSPAEFATRHVLESLMLLPHLRTNARVVDIGSGAGLPIIPCLIARSDIHATMIEASPKKSVFLSEAIRQTALSTQAVVVVDRFENAPPVDADYVTSRALDRFAEMLPQLVEWSSTRESELLLFGSEHLASEVEAAGLRVTLFRIPDSERRFLIRGRR